MIGKKIGNYKIIEEIGSGGMGVVYKAVDQASEKVVAIKTIKENISKNSETFFRFKKKLSC